MAASGINEYLPPENAQELLRRYAGDERRFPGVELSDADLAGAMLDGTDFEGSWFCDASFEGASLRGTSFRLKDGRTAARPEVVDETPTVFQEIVCGAPDCWL
jgi:hypothetical protein